MHRVLCLAFAAFAVLAAPNRVFAASQAMTLIDTDKDGTIDMQEAIAAASALFAQRSHGKEKYLALVENRFKAADIDGDGTIDETELRSAAGRILIGLLPSHR